MFDENSFDAVIARYAQACMHRRFADVREGYIKLRAMCEGQARGIDSGEAGETRSGSTPKGQEPGAREGTRPAESESAQPSLHIEPAAWAIYDSQGFYEARATEDEARRFCDRYNRRETDPLKPYTFYPLYTVPTTPTEGPAQPLTPEALYAIVPPSATEYMSQPPAMEFSTEWQIGWDSCRNGVRHRVYDLIAKSKSAGTLKDPEGAS